MVSPGRLHIFSKNIKSLLKNSFHLLLFYPGVENKNDFEAKKIWGCDSLGYQRKKNKWKSFKLMSKKHP